MAETQQLQATTFPVIGQLIIICPRCKDNGRKTRIVRESVRDHACCPRCGWHVKPTK